ncbi:D-lactate dehydrogenase [Thiolapillus brandeum]|uniref:Quinone-dependent D-lactate dehydrogenase n=1 Tax=Thiolapillus brandeum TaxID=1076588 RepID=A0A7U6GHU4_9GAMM|nr:D-lactate dehydrogenase [Thiolapillus brandeum]BAO43873.1 D-lactate dehydrogenase [Thiolapillus brandeum]
MNHRSFIDALRQLLSSRQVLTSDRKTLRYRCGIRIGEGKVNAVVLPHSAMELWETLKLCIRFDKIIILQAANTGLNGGSTPYGNDYDRDVVIISTRRLNRLGLLRGGRQVIACAGTTLTQLEDALRPMRRGPHSVIGSSCIGASVIGGVCNNSGGNLLNRGPSYSELALYAQLDAAGQLTLVNHLGLDLGESPEEILSNLDQANLDARDVWDGRGMASDHEYSIRVRDIHATTPARFNADPRRLHEASGCAGKLAVFAVRLDTFPLPEREQVFFIGTNQPDDFTRLRKRMLSQFEDLPEMAEYMHASYFDGAHRYCKDSYLLIRLLGARALPRLLAVKSWLDGLCSSMGFLPTRLPDKLLQYASRLLPEHLPRSIRAYRKCFEHFLILKCTDATIEATQQFLRENFGEPSRSPSGQSTGWFKCTSKEGESALLHRFVAGGATARYATMHAGIVGEIMPLDVALPRNSEDWHELLPPELLEQLAAPYCLAHFFCMVFHWDFVVKKGLDAEELKRRIMALLDEKGAKYPAEHNVGHVYEAEPVLADFYRQLDPTNSFNAGVGKMSKYKYYAD